ncbi:PQ loop repeat family protein [Plasmodium vivax Brazil I]|uniref:PQ loop repeat family protein n=1 Tax=Plasmodium vivax (strain Brazil I) TaxID=1033975 RepID=A0A0J9STT7_PLAV1|nr:PQ loop repeat family protein [Plasmodium vivax Brazil I]
MKSANFNVFSEGFYDKQNIASVLNSVFIYSTIVGSCFTKIPQLTKIVSKKNAAGISFTSVYVEILVATSLIVFSIKEKLAIKLFVDVILINTQNILIVLFMWKYSNSCLSKVPQIYVNYKNQSTGNLSFASYLLIFCGNLARIYIILFNVENWIYLMLYYRNKACLTAKKDKEKQL